MDYYTSLYAKISTCGDEFVQYNLNINDISGLYQQIMAACDVNEELTDEKIHAIAKEADRLWVLFVLNGIYDSNEFQDVSYRLNEKLKGLDMASYREVYDEIIIQSIREKRNVSGEVSLLDFNSFLRKNYTNTNRRFLRYLFSRIEKFICEHTNQNMQNDIYYISTKTGNKTGYHIEHILSENEKNRGYFKDVEEFDDQRNLLGGLLLLKGLDNISSGNEEYSDKLKTYSNGLVWGHSLCEDFYHANKDFDKFNKELSGKCNVGFKAYSVFDQNALMERSRLLYEIVKVIWEVS